MKKEELKSTDEEKKATPEQKSASAPEEKTNKKASSSPKKQTPRKEKAVQTPKTADLLATEEELTADPEKELLNELAEQSAPVEEDENAELLEKVENENLMYKKL